MNNNLKSATTYGSRNNSLVFSDSLARYFKDVEAYPLLTAAEELELGKRIKENKDEVAFNKMYTSNLRLVIKIASEFKNSRMEFLDLIQEGNIGLGQAVEHFDYTRGNRFSTCAALWIKQAITRGINKAGYAVGVPNNVAEKMMKVRRAEAELLDELGRIPTNEELAERTGLPLDKIEDCQLCRQDAMSLAAPIGESEDDGVFGDLIPCSTALLPENMFEKSEFHRVLQKALSKLDPREQSVLILLFGLNPKAGKKSLREIGEIYGVTYERIRQLKEGALAKLREADDLNGLAEFLAA